MGIHYILKPPPPPPLAQILSGLYLSRTVARGQGRTDLKTVGDTPWPRDVSTYQI